LVQAGDGVRIDGIATNPANYRRFAAGAPARGAKRQSGGGATVRLPPLLLRIEQYTADHLTKTPFYGSVKEIGSLSLAARSLYPARPNQIA
jgi:hypothetical protein